MNNTKIVPKTIPEIEKRYEIKLSNNEAFEVDGLQKNAILRSKAQMIELPNGSVINKSFIICIRSLGYSVPAGYKLLKTV